MRKAGLYKIVLVVLLFSVCQNNWKASSELSRQSFGLPHTEKQINQENIDNGKSLDEMTTAIARSKNYLDCWTGIKGGKIMFTSNIVYDLGSKEKSAYKFITKLKPGSTSGLQTGENYSFEDVETKLFLRKNWERSSRLHDPVSIEHLDAKAVISQLNIVMPRKCVSSVSPVSCV